jgi:hypothetical protein
MYTDLFVQGLSPIASIAIGIGIAIAICTFRL